MTLAVLRPSADPWKVQIAGPAGQPSVTPVGDDRNPPSRMAATQLQKAVVDTMSRLQKSCSPSCEYDSTDYGVTVVPGDFWTMWYAQNQGLDVVTYDVVFELAGDA